MRGQLPYHLTPDLSLTMDVVAMYLSIPPEEGVEATKCALRKSGMEEEKVQYVGKLLKMVLEYNVFTWGDQLIQQLFGTAIGTSCAPAYSCIYMGKLEEEGFAEWEEQNPEPVHHMQDWTRLIDDGWGLWRGSEEKLVQFLNFLSSRKPSIKFTMEYTCPKDCERRGQNDHECRDFLNYLDMKMFIDGDGHIQTDLYRKPHTKCQYLRPDSSHPRHVCANIPKSLVHRIVRICSVPGMREVRLQELKELLVGRGYKRGVVDEAVQYGLALDRTEALKKVSREEASQKRVRYNIIFDPKLPNFPPILVKNWKEIVNSDQRLKSPFPAPPMASLKRSPNLAHELWQSGQFASAVLP